MIEPTHHSNGTPSGNRRIRKWYFSLSEASIERKDHGWRGLTRVAVASALRNTSLQPYMLYDGQESDFTAELRAMGVTVIFHRVSFYDRLVEIAPTRTADYLGIALGVFPRVEIPWLELEDDVVLFTDCDVMFLGDLHLEGVPEFFAAAPQMSQTDYENDMNAGVMVMNVPALRADLPRFINFITDHLGDGWPGCDQENYRRFYNGRWDRLDLTLNWKPYWGDNSAARIVHWHGPKPPLVRRMLADPALQTVTDWKMLFERNAGSYESFLKVWDAFAVTTRHEIIGHLDVFSESGGGGWAIYPENLPCPVTLTIRIDGELVGTIVCNQPRSDIKAAYGVETAGFTFSIPGRFSDSKPHMLELCDAAGFSVSLKRNGAAVQSHWFSHSRVTSALTGQKGGYAQESKNLTNDSPDLNVPCVANTGCLDAPTDTIESKPVSRERKLLAPQGLYRAPGAALEVADSSPATKDNVATEVSMFALSGPTIGSLIRWGFESSPNRGAHMTRFFMYRVLKDLLIEQDAEYKTVLAISHSIELGKKLGLTKCRYTEANYPSHSMVDLKFATAEFDFCVSDQVLEHVEGDPVEAFVESARIVKDGGFLCHTTCFNMPIHGSPSDYWRYTPESLKLMCRLAKCEPVHVGGWGNREAWAIIQAGFATQGIPEDETNPLYKIATTNDLLWPIVVWVVARKPISC
jgi:hypothetical protein